MALIARGLIVTGRVQGVWYRRSCQQEARRLGVTGWVRNLPSGAVEAFVQGSPEAVEALIAWCRQGPPLARVDAVAVSQEPLDRRLEGFATRP